MSAKNKTKNGFEYYVYTLTHYTRLYLKEIGKMKDWEHILGFEWNTDIRVKLIDSPPHLHPYDTLSKIPCRTVFIDRKVVRRIRDSMPDEIRPQHY